MSWRKLKISNIENYMRTVMDLKKEFTLDKSSGLWYWYDRGEPETLYGGFACFLDVLEDIVSPYVEDRDE
jgi:hypothetical protein